MNKILGLFLIVTLFFSCKNSSTNNNITQSDSSQTVDNQQNNVDNADYLSIIGNQIWVRSEPQTGDVVLKLDDGVQCEVLEKGQQQTINGVTDYWYKIKVNGQEGWVFGSQTSLRQNAVVDENTQIKNYFTYFFEKLQTENYQDLKSYFIDDSVIVLDNPGAFVYFSIQYYTDVIGRVDATNFDGNIKFNNLPTFDMDTFEWSENGFFVETNSQDDVISYLVQYGDYPQYLIDKVTELEKNISNRFLIAYEDGIYIYFGKVNSKWKIIAIDISTNDA